MTTKTLKFKNLITAYNYLTIRRFIKTGYNKIGLNENINNRYITMDILVKKDDDELDLEELMEKYGVKDDFVLFKIQQVMEEEFVITIGKYLMTSIENEYIAFQDE